jgi:acetyl-CoA carboxylase biotin carboxyl carrier protein
VSEDGPSPPPADPLFDQTGVSADELGQLLELLATTDITQLDVSLGVTRLSLRRPAAPPPVASLAASGTPQPAEREPASLAIASPLVGIFRPSVSVGDSVSPGQPIGAIEALGMPNTVDAPQGGTVEDLLVPTGSPVEYGQPLLILRRPLLAPAE